MEGVGGAWDWSVRREPAPALPRGQVPQGGSAGKAAGSQRAQGKF